MRDVPNPFFYGGPVPYSHFIGRKTVVNTIFDQILNRCSTALYGESGIGKSSVLKSIATPETWQTHGMDSSGVMLVSLNCRLGEPFTPRLFWSEILTLLRDQVEGNAPLRHEIDRALSSEIITVQHFQRVLRRIDQAGKYVVLLLDDFDAALETHETYSEAQMRAFLDGVRRMAVHNPDGPLLSVTVTTFKPLNEAGVRLRPGQSPWYNHYLFQPLHPFNDEEIRTLLDKTPVEHALSPKEVQSIRQIAGGHPALLQIICALLYRERIEGRVIDFTQVSRQFEERAQQHFSGFWDSSSEVEQMLLMLIALSHLEGRLSKKHHYDLGDLDLIFSQYERELRVLETRGLIKSAGVGEGRGRYRYTIFSPIMEWWVIKEIENSSNEALEQRQLVFNRLSRKQAEQIKGVMRFVWSNKDTITSIAKWVVEAVSEL